MGYKTILFTNPCNISIKHNQLFCTLLATEEKITVPMEDISVIILENPRIMLTNYFLSACGEYNITVLTCDKKHIPNAILTPFYQHSRNTKIAYSQISMKEVLKNRLWQKIVRQKITNQSFVLKTLFDINELDNYLPKIQSADKTNIEGQTSKLYWKLLFKNFKRHEKTVINSALDYGYAIIRGTISKHVAASGLIPCFGVHHHNELNAFNLTEDLIEPFRPFVDLQVARMAPHLKDELTKEDKGILLNVLHKQCEYKKEHISIQTACENVCKSYVRAIELNDYNGLKLPKFEGLK